MLLGFAFLRLISTANISSRPIRSAIPRCVQYTLNSFPYLRGDLHRVGYVIQARYIL